MNTIYDTDGPVATLTFNRPEARNAMTWEMYDDLVAACERVDSDDAIRVLVFRGAGGKAFVAGTDIAQFQNFKNRDDGVKYEERATSGSPRLKRRSGSRSLARSAIASRALATADCSTSWAPAP
jgi:enoyl-CoA hydratase/carnithine racemase